MMISRAGVVVIMRKISSRICGVETVEDAHDARRLNTILYCAVQDCTFVEVSLVTSGDFVLISSLHEF